MSDDANYRNNRDIMVVKRRITDSDEEYMSKPGFVRFDKYVFEVLILPEGESMPPIYEVHKNLGKVNGDKKLYHSMLLTASSMADELNGNPAQVGVWMDPIWRAWNKNKIN